MFERFPEGTGLGSRDAEIVIVSWNIVRLIVVEFPFGLQANAVQHHFFPPNSHGNWLDILFSIIGRL